MPKVTNPLFSGDARGKFGDMIIFTRGGQVRRYFKPRNPNTPAQQAQRQAFKEFYMPSLTQEQADLLYSAILHDHAGLYSPLGHDHAGLYSPLGHDHAGLYSPLGHDHGYLYPQSVVTLVDGASVAINAALGGTFLLSAAGDRILTAPTGAVDGQTLIIGHYASGAARSLTLAGGVGGFALPSAIAITQTASGKWDYIGAKYNSILGKWAVLAYQKGY